MNKLLTPNGGMPLEGDDFRWEQDAIREAMKGMLHYYALPTSGHLILSGCAISFAAGNASVTEGYVCINFEVCYVPAHTVAVASLAASSLKIVETYDPSGLEVFADSVSRDTYAIRRALISDGLAGSNEIVLASPPRLETVLASALQIVGQQVTAFEAGFSATAANELYISRRGGIVVLEGGFDTTQTGTGWGNTLALTIPAGYRPPAKRSFFLVDDMTTDSSVRMDILPSGEVRISSVEYVGAPGDPARFLPSVCWTI